MTITLKSTGNPDTVLCHGSADIGTAGKHIGPTGDIRTEAEWSIRPKRPIGAADETPLDGGHAVWPFAFSTFVEFSTVEACQEFAETWAATLHRANTSLVIDYTSGNQTTRPTAILKKIIIQQFAIRAHIDYLFQTGRPTNTTPEA